MLLLLSCFSHVLLLATPWTAAYQAPLFMEFSRQDYRSGLPLPFPSLLILVLKSVLLAKEESEVKVTQSCPTLCDPMDYTVHGILQARMLEWVAYPFFRGSSQPGIEPRSPPLQVDSLPGEPPGKTKNTGMGSLSLLQGIFLTQELNQGLLHSRQLLYQLNYQGRYSL